MLSSQVRYDNEGVIFTASQLQAFEVEKVEEHFDTVGEGGVVMDLLVDVENAQLLEKELEVTCKGRVSVSFTVSNSYLLAFRFHILKHAHVVNLSSSTSLL